MRKSSKSNYGFIMCAHIIACTNK